MLPFLHCVHVNHCFSQQCPLNPAHNVEEIQPGQECELPEYQRNRIALDHPNVLRYNGRTAKEHRAVLMKLESKRHRLNVRETTEARKALRKLESAKRKKARDEALERARLQKQLTELTEDIPLEKLRVLVKDTKIRLKPNFKRQ